MDPFARARRLTGTAGKNRRTPEMEAERRRVVLDRLSPAKENQEENNTDAGGE